MYGLRQSESMTCMTLKPKKKLLPGNLLVFVGLLKYNVTFRLCSKIDPHFTSSFSLSHSHNEASSSVNIVSISQRMPSITNIKIRVRLSNSEPNSTRLFLITYLLIGV